MCAKQSYPTASVWNVLQKASTITLLAHFRPDADSLGSCAALGMALERLGKSIEIVYPTSLADPIPFTIPHLQVGTHTQTPDLIISCDVSTQSRLYWHESFNGLPLVVIDHHINNTIPGDHLLVDEAASSTCELVYQLLRDNNQDVDADMAAMLLYGILCDTLSFRTPNTTPAVLRIASELVECGADLATLQRAMITHDKPATLKLWGSLLSSGQSNADGTAFWCVCSQEMLTGHGVGEEALIGFISMLSQNTAIEVTALFYEQTDGKSKASLRAKTKDIRQIAVQFGGGGHKLAAGVSSDLPLADLVARVTTQL